MLAHGEVKLNTLLLPVVLRLRAMIADFCWFLPTVLSSGAMDKTRNLGVARALILSKPSGAISLNSGQQTLWTKASEYRLNSLSSPPASTNGKPSFEPAPGLNRRAARGTLRRRSLGLAGRLRQSYLCTDKTKTRRPS